MTPGAPPPVELIPAQPQTLWGKLAVANFALGGTGAGLYVVAAAAARLGTSPALTLASWLAPALVLAGFAAVAAEAGRPLRGPRVPTRLASSWMSREVAIGGAFILLAGVEFAAPGPLLRLLAALAAAMLAIGQGSILWRARGVAAWAVPVMPPLFLVSAVVSGAGLHLLIEVAAGRRPGGGLLGTVLGLLVLGTLTWLGFLTWSGDETFRRATRPLREGSLARELVGLGYLAPFVLVALGLALPSLAPPAAGIAAALMIAGQAQAKAALILRAGQLRPITLSRLRLSRRPS